MAHKKKAFAGYPEVVYVEHVDDPDGAYNLIYDNAEDAFDGESAEAELDLAVYELRSVKRCKLEKQLVEV